MQQFRFTPVGEFVKEPRRITEHDLEAAYRRGYSQGYAAAAQDLGALIKAGYSRLKEIQNFLVAHADALYMGWRVRHSRRQDSSHFPPRLEVESWQALRRKVLARDGYACGFCGAVEDLQLDHIKQVQHGGVASEGNLRVLCGPCNRGRNTQELA